MKDRPLDGFPLQSHNEQHGLSQPRKKSSQPQKKRKTSTTSALAKPKESGDPRGCFQFTTSGGGSKTKCLCVHNLCKAMRDESRTSPNSKAVLKKWCAQLEPWIEAVRGVAEAPDSEESLFGLLELAHPYSKPDKANAVCDLMVCVGDTYISFCLSSMWQFLGYVVGKSPVHKHLRQFFNADHCSDMESQQRYMRMVVLPRSPKRILFQGLMEQCLAAGKIPPFEAYNEDLLTTCLRKKIGKQMSENGNLIENKSNRSKYYSPVREALIKHDL